MTQPNSTQPRTSPTYQPGYIPASGDVTHLTHNDWVEALTNYLSNRWANGDHSIVPPAQYGIPDDSGLITPATTHAFANWASHYQPGDNPQIDAVMPFVAPSADDFQESPAQIAARVAQSNWDATFGQTQSNQDRLAWQQQFANEIQSYGYQVSGANNANDFAASLFGTQAGEANSENSLAANIFNTQGSIYNANENNRQQSLGQAGTLASALQGLWDQRTQNAINLQAHPNDFIERESAVRAMQPPTGTDQPAYSNVDALQEVINRLINFQPSGGQPTAPAPAAHPAAPGYVAPPAPPQQTPFSTFQSAARGSTGSGPAAPVARPAGQPAPLASLVHQVNAQQNLTGPMNTGTAAHPQMSVDQSNNYWEDNGTPGGVWHDPVGHISTDGGKTWVPAHAQGAADTLDRHMIIGDPQANGQPNPEMVSISGQNVHTRITPLQDMLPRYAYGTEGDPYGGNDQWGGNTPGGGYGGGAAGGNMLYPDSGMKPPTADLQRPPQSAPASPMSAPGRMEDGPGSGWTTKPPTTQPVSAPGTMVYQGTSGIPPSQQAPQMTLRSYPNSAYQNLPSLQYLLGRLSPGAYNTLATGTAQGAFGTQAPESGSINYKRALDISQDPISQALLESIYSSANRDYLSEVSRAKARAPFGQAVNTSLVRT